MKGKVTRNDVSTVAGTRYVELCRPLKSLAFILLENEPSERADWKQNI